MYCVACKDAMAAARFVRRSAGIVVVCVGMT
jgi:hypothetical protein